MAHIAVPTVYGQLKVEGAGKKQRLVRAQFSADQLPRYDLFSKKCTKCHVMARPIAALQTGITPVSNGPFNGKSIKKYVVKMMRKTDSGIERSEARELIKFLTYARGLAKQPAKSPAAD